MDGCTDGCLCMHLRTGNVLPPLPPPKEVRRRGPLRCFCRRPGGTEPYKRKGERAKREKAQREAGERPAHAWCAGQRKTLGSREKEGKSPERKEQTGKKRDAFPQTMRFCSRGGREGRKRAPKGLWQSSHLEFCLRCVPEMKADSTIQEGSIQSSKVTKSYEVLSHATSAGAGQWPFQPPHAMATGSRRCPLPLPHATAACPASGASAGASGAPSVAAPLCASPWVWFCAASPATAPVPAVASEAAEGAAGGAGEEGAAG